MSQGQGAGRPTKFNDAISKLIIKDVRSHLSIQNAAKCVGLSHATILTWLKIGETELSEGLDTQHVKFLTKLRAAQGLKVKELMLKVEEMPKCWQAIAWLLEKCCADEFGKDSELTKQLLEDYKMLMQTLVDKGNAK